ncbi:KIN17-like protein [Fulvia fulva]|uniref:KIN17-like protein n=1 Tax=Passalora fulva TaxID=5499 RepID=A0A9Q8PAB1_PASFU|nr:KIN17-like protein [Fulvia fulva]KAK4621468.1 KIN17-like protein [Fulvia fulva]KAK4622581.1 KIN17-like protein [Fulvia fulva]UJO18800.1 KIN17-like protein [Fulvia fulva]WPV16507.1 KIN17-like protein [Fulvia fulva]WPV30641.1 KIN17-like protein [Fulvia fulva]
MGKAEVGSTKYVANKMKAKGLQRLRWYCQICEKQCRDENGFKQHTMSEGHVRAMVLVGEDPKKFINDYSRQFQRDFLQLLRTAHGEKKVHMNNFYQEYIRDKEHVHMNATKWPSLTEFAKHLGREGICRVEEGDRGLEISWIDDSAAAISRREDIKKKDRLAKGDEDIESRLLEQQVKRAQEEAAKKRKAEEQLLPPPTSAEGDAAEDKPTEPVKVSGFSLKAKAPVKVNTAPEEKQEGEAVAIDTFSSADKPHEPTLAKQEPDVKEEDDITPAKPEAPAKLSLAGLKKAKAGNPLAKKNPFAKPKAAAAPEPEKKMSNAERIMKEEMERKRLADERGHGAKRQRMS